MLTSSSLIDGPNPERGDDSDLPPLVKGARAGQRAALERLIARVQQRVRTWAERFTEDADSADDIAQDVLIGLERRVKGFDERSRFSTWLFAVTRNVALTRRRREQHRARLLEQHSVRTVPDSPAAADPDAAVLAKLALIYFDALPRQQRKIFELADIKGMKPAEIARALGMEQATVRAHLFKARKAIRSQLLTHHERLLKEYQS